jgi:hypothetical protein
MLLGRADPDLPVHQKIPRKFSVETSLTLELQPVWEEQFLLYFRGQTPHNSERIATFAGRNQPSLFHRFYSAAIGRERADYFVVFQSAQDRIAAERISFKLVAVSHVRQQVQCGSVQSGWHCPVTRLQHFCRASSGSPIIDGRSR